MKNGRRFVKLMLFDLDGTLVDSKKDITDAVNHALNEVGLEQKDPDEISSYIGTGVKDLISKSLGEKADKTIFDKVLSAFEKYFAEHYADNSRLYEGVREMLEYFKDKEKAIVTNRNYIYAVLTMKKLGIYGFFKKIIGGDNFRCAKPSSCPIENVITDISAEKENIIMIGDMSIDVISGKNAGVLTCAVTYGIGKKEDILRAGPDFVIDNISALKDIIE
ncbi:MAG: HAD-IA family hydrolase [Candidatus Omnitrophica bacterium]|nr:HAD-IA family hydrolase [Candidatus Omnitrophota bacterium]